MAEKQNLDSLNEKRLGDGKLSKEELSYIKSQEQLWYKNIGDKLFQDIIDTNTTILSQDKVLGSFVDEILNDSLLMKQIVAKSGLQFPGINQQLASKNPTEKYYILVNVLLHGCNAMSEVQSNLVTNINKPAITGATIKSLHRFQKKGETVNGRSKADCLIGKKTIQQMLAKIGVQTKQNKVDSTFASSNITAKEKYDYNVQQQKQMDIIINDPILSDVEKTQKLIQVAKNTVEKGSDGLDKKYGAVSYMMTRISDKIMRDKGEKEVDSIIQIIQGDGKILQLIKKYWNENSAKQFGANPSLIKKTSNWAQDLTERKETLENNRDNIKAMISAYRGYLDTLSQDYKGLDWATDIDEKLKDHVKKIDKFLYEIDNTIFYKDDNILAKKMESLMNDPHSQRLLDSEYAKVFIKNKTKGSEQYEYYLAYNDMKKLISNPGGWGDKGKEKFVQLLRSMDNNDDSTLLVNSYESSDATKDITKEAVDNKLSQSKDTKNIMNKFSSLFKPDKDGNYSGEYNTLLQHIESGNEDAARQHLNKVLKGLSTDDAWYPNFIGGNDYIDDLMDSVKSLKEKEKETKKDIEQGLENEISKLAKLEENGTISNTGQGQLDKLRTMKEDDTLSLMVDNSYKEMKNAIIANSIGHEMRTQMLDKYPTLFSKGSSSLVDNYANVVGAGDYLSDSTVESIQSVIVEVIIQVILAIVSFGAANAALAGARAIGSGISRGAVTRYLSKAAAESLVKRVIVNAGRLAFQGTVYTAVTATGNAVKNAQDIDQIRKIAGKDISWQNIFSNGAMMGILSKFKALSELGKLKDGVTVTKTINNFVATKLSNTATRVVAEEVSINLTQGGSKLIFGDGKFTTQDFIEASAQGLAFEMIPGMGDINVFKSGKDLMMKTIVNGKIYTGTIDQVLFKLEIDHPGTKSLVENNAKQKGVDKLVFKNQKKSSPNTKKESMPRERARNQLPPKSPDKIAELKQNNEVKKTELENNIKNLEQEKQQLLKQRKEVLSSLDQTNKPKDYKNLNNTLSNLKNQKLLLESELAQMKTNPNNPAKNAYFMEHAKELVGKNIWIDGKNYSVSHINTNGSLEIKLKDGAERISLSSFTELQQRGQVNGFADSGGSALKNSETDNHAKLQELFQGEKEYMTTRVNDLITKQQKITEMDTKVRDIEEQLIGAKSFQNKVDERAKKLSDVNKKISANESANTKAWKDYLETDKLDGKYYNDMKQNINGGKNNIPQSYNDTPDVKIENKISFEESLDKAAQGIADNIFKDTPSTKTDAVSMVEKFGFWLGNTKVGPSLQFLENAWKWLGDIKLKFPDINLGQKIDEIKKSIRESAIQKRLSVIDSYTGKSFDQQVVFWQKNKNKDLSLREYQKIYEVLSGRKIDFQSKTPKYFRQGDNLENEWKKEFKDEIDSYITHASFISNSKVVGGDLHLNRGNEVIDVIPLVEIDFIPSYKTGEGVKIPRSDGSTSKGTISSFDSKTGEYKVVREENGRSYNKKINQAELNKVNVLQVDIDIAKVDQVKDNLLNNSILSRKNNIDGFNKNKMSDLSQKFIEKFGDPKHIIDLGGSKLYVTDKLENGSYKYILGYTDKGDMRMFYRSGSEGEWRSCPGHRGYEIEKNKETGQDEKKRLGYSKGDNILGSSYETTTKLESSINLFFDQLPSRFISKDPIQESFELSGRKALNEDQMQKEIRITRMFPNLDLLYGAVSFYKDRSVQQVKREYSDLIIPGLDLKSLENIPNKAYMFRHDQLGMIEVDVVTTKYNGKDVDIHFANADDGKVFITNIVYSDAKINSFGVYDRQINAGPITAKPIDYAIKDKAWQVPSDAAFKKYGSYMDIRDLYQDLPLIKEYKSKFKKNQPKDIGLSSKEVDNEIPTLEISSIIESKKPADGAIIQGVGYEPNDVQSIRVDIEDIANSDYGNQQQQDDYRNKKQQEEDEFLNDMIINNAGADMFRGMDE